MVNRTTLGAEATRRKLPRSLSIEHDSVSSCFIPIYTDQYCKLSMSCQGAIVSWKIDVRSLKKLRTFEPIMGNEVDQRSGTSL